MQKAEQILQAIRKLGEKRIPLTRIYRSLYSEDLFLAAYNKIYRNQGSLTQGTEDDTVDGMSMERIRQVIEELRSERFRFRPSRRIQIPKKSGGKRPLGIPNFTEKLIQQVLKMLLEAYYEPRFRNSSHGFRPQRGCHTALKQIHQQFQGTAWFIEGDIKGCFDNIDHTILMSILAKDIQDGRLLNLIQKSLKAGILEDWQYHQTYSGTPQGGILSPLLSNIYMHELDVFIEDTLIPQYTRGKSRGHNLEYKRLSYQIKQARQQGDRELEEELVKLQRTMPTQNPQADHYRRLKYVRYADDFILAFAGPKAEAEAIKTAIATFLKEKLKLEMSATKTLITHARTQHARFLGYAISISHADDKLTRRRGKYTKTRSANGNVRLGLPSNLIQQHTKRYKRKGKIVGEGALIDFSDAHIINTYQSRFRGLAEYYKYAADRHRLHSLKYVMEIALTKTLAQKYRTSVKHIYRKYHNRQVIEGHEWRTLQVEVPTKQGTVCIYWGAIPLKTIKFDHTDKIDDRTRQDVYKWIRSDLIVRLQADTCELCGSTEHVEVHHIRKLADLKKRWAGRKTKPYWVKRMIAIRRKTLVVCRKCHRDIHAGRLSSQTRE